MKFHTPYEECNPIGLPNNGDRIVETLGYISREQKIKNYEQAGVKLAASRLEQYDADANANEEQFIYNPYRDIGFDFSDAHRCKKQLERMIKNQKSVVEREMKKEEERKAKLDENLAKDNPKKSDLSPSEKETN